MNDTKSPESLYTTFSYHSRQILANEEDDLIHKTAAEWVYFNSFKKKTTSVTARRKKKKIVEHNVSFDIKSKRDNLAETPF